MVIRGYKEEEAIIGLVLFAMSDQEMEASSAGRQEEVVSTYMWPARRTGNDHM